ncbi:hypothetical protein G6F63_014668 [Rhizopus arrhizus]|nr:hypothetical protein G6F31_017779 [Rhizopus arrhizus]KAG1319581.1 hypothetical protein G6F63_014668 [Rhizopus arrhizus]
MAAAAWSWGLDQHRGLDGHVQRAGHAHALQRQLGLVLAADRHQARHLVLGDVQFLAAPVGQRDVADLVITFGGEGLGNSVHSCAPVVGERVLASGRAPLLHSHLTEPGRASWDPVAAPLGRGGPPLYRGPVMTQG